jgi:hypothetical protein
VGLPVAIKNLSTLCHQINLEKLMDQKIKNPSRKKFLLWGATILSSVTVLKFISGGKKKKSETVKMLTQDGKLVEVDIVALSAKKKKITNTELQNWIEK